MDNVSPNSGETVGFVYQDNLLPIMIRHCARLRERDSELHTVSNIPLPAVEYSQYRFAVNVRNVAYM